MLGYELPANYKPLEQNTVADIYYHCRLAGLPMMLEVRIPTNAFKRGNCRADLALVYKKIVLSVIEVKRSGNSDASFQKNKINRNGKQFRKYKDIADNYGVKVFFMNRKTPIEPVIRELKRILKRHKREVDKGKR